MAKENPFITWCKNGKNCPHFCRKAQETANFFHKKITIETVCGCGKTGTLITSMKEASKNCLFFAQHIGSPIT